MALLTLPPWIKEGQTVQTNRAPKHLPGVWTIVGIRSASLRDGMVRIEQRTDDTFRSEWIDLDVFLRDWRRTDAH